MSDTLRTWTIVIAGLIVPLFVIVILAAAIPD